MTNDPSDAIIDSPNKNNDKQSTSLPKKPEQALTASELQEKEFKECLNNLIEGVVGNVGDELEGRMGLGNHEYNPDAETGVRYHDEEEDDREQTLMNLETNNNSESSDIENYAPDNAPSPNLSDAENNTSSRSLANHHNIGSHNLLNHGLLDQGGSSSQSVNHSRMPKRQNPLLNLSHNNLSHEMNRSDEDSTGDSFSSNKVQNLEINSSTEFNVRNNSSIGNNSPTGNQSPTENNNNNDSSTENNKSSNSTHSKSLNINPDDPTGAHVAEQKIFFEFNVSRFKGKTQMNSRSVYARGMPWQLLIQKREVQVSFPKMSFFGKIRSF